MLDLKKNIEFKFDLDCDASILMKKMIKESINSRLINFKIELVPNYTGMVRILINSNNLELLIFDEVDSSYTLDLIELGIFEFSDYFKVDNFGIQVEKESLESILVLSAGYNNIDLKLLNNIKEVIKNCKQSYYTKKANFSFEKISFDDLTIKRFENNKVVLDYFYQAFKQSLRETNYNNVQNRQLEFWFKIFSDFYKEKEKELEELRVDFIKQILNTDFGLNIFINVFESLFLNFSKNKNGIILENSPLLDNFKNSESLKKEQLFEEFMRFFNPKELSISLISNRKIVPVIDKEILKRLKENQLTFKNCGYQLNIRGLSDYQFKTLIRFIKANQSKLEVQLSLEIELINDEINLESEILMLNRLKELQKLSEKNSVIFKGVDTLTQFIQDKIDLLELI